MMILKTIKLIYIRLRLFYYQQDIHVNTRVKILFILGINAHLLVVVFISV